MSSKWTEILADEELLIKMTDAAGPEEIQKLLKENGYEFTLEEICAAGEELSAQFAAQGDAELSEDDLEDVAGGAKKKGSVGSALASLLKPTPRPMPHGRKCIRPF